MLTTFFTLSILISYARCHPAPVSVHIFQKLIHDIQNYTDIAKKIINYSLNGSGQNQSYDRLAKFVDKYGTCFSGSESLEDSIDYMLYQLQQDGFDNVH